MFVRYFSLLIMIYFACAGHYAYAVDDIVSEQRSGNWDLYADTQLTEYGAFRDGTINIKRSLKIINNGWK